MKKEVVLAFGVPEERLKEFQDVYNRDLKKAVIHHENGSIRSIRNAINSMLPMIRSEEDMREILRVTAESYSRPPRQPETSE